jgi:thiol:disulfide interchange protein
MKRLAAFLSILAGLSLACGALSTPAPNTATLVPLAPILAPQDTEEASAQSVDQLPELPNSALVDVYNPHRDPAEDLKQAISIAQSQNKRIMLELGGDWCIWCKYMDEFYAAHADLLQFRADHFVLVKINVSDQNMNEGFLSQFPAAAGYPHIYILDSDGKFLHSQDTVELEDGGQSYVLDVFMAFLQEWASPE